MPNPSVHPLIFTDLDGTLLDHDSYSAEPADMLIKQITERAIGTVIPITSKTRAELRSLQGVPTAKLISVTENGSVIHVPQGHPFERAGDPEHILLGTAYPDILAAINALPHLIRQYIRGFSDMTDAEVSKATGLGLEAARRARDREASEPFLWSGLDQDLDELGLLMAGAKIRIQRGGRFFHFTGDASKAQAMAIVKNAASDRHRDSAFISIALGDGPNDLEMIEAADIGVIMPNPAGVPIRSDKAHVRIAPAPGPKGWTVALRELFSEMGIILRES